MSEIEVRYTCAVCDVAMTSVNVPNCKAAGCRGLHLACMNPECAMPARFKTPCCAQLSVTVDGFSGPPEVQ